MGVFYQGKRHCTPPSGYLSTGKCVQRLHIGRAPSSHINGSASSLTQVVNFYNARFGMNLNPQQKTDLVNFLSAL